VSGPRRDGTGLFGGRRNRSERHQAHARDTATSERKTNLKNKEQLPLFLTVDEAAHLMRIGRNTCYAACRSGQVPSVRIGGRILIGREALMAKVAGPPMRDVALR
jgi:excisionase family DNA binding protein